MSHTVRVGDKFRLLDREWTIGFVGYDKSFSAKETTTSSLLIFSHHEADKLDWIKPVPKCSKEFAEAVKREFMNVKVAGEVGYRQDYFDLHQWLDSHTE